MDIETEVECNRRCGVVDGRDGLFLACYMNARWPTSWQGQTYMDCGADRQVLTLVSTPSQPNGIHEGSYQAVVSGWQFIWPDFRSSITALMDQYKRVPADWSSIRTLYLELSDERLAEHAEWSIGVVFSAAETMRVLRYRGLAPVPEEAQAIW